MNWSGGKDAALALYTVLSERELEVTSLLTSINDCYKRVSMHGLREELLLAQSQSIGIDLRTLRLSEKPSMDEYERTMQEQINYFRQQSVSTAIFGDIFLEDIRSYREKMLSSAGINTVFPLWKLPQREILDSFFRSGFKAIVICVDAKRLGKGFAGRLFDESFINDLPKNVDICGENGEFHTFVYDGPIFKQPISFKIGEIVHKLYPASQENIPANEFFFCDLLSDQGI